jgi:hypothetical protein
MKNLARIIAWLLLATIVLAWQAGPISFQQRWVSMPSAMPAGLIEQARRAAERPNGMTYTFCKYPACKRG